MAKTALKQISAEINLLPQEELTESFGKLVSWILTLGRYIIILTEIVALGTFAYSVKLTIERNDLKESIIAQQDLIEDSSKFENEFRLVQTRLQNLKSLESNHIFFEKILDELNSLLPIGVVLTELKVDQNTITFGGDFSSEETLQTLINSIEKSDKISNLEITKITVPNETSPNFTFGATATINSKAFTSQIKLN